MNNLAIAALADPLAAVSRAQGLLLGRLADVGMVLRDEASLSAQIQRERKAYYDILERTQKGDMDDAMVNVVSDDAAKSHRTQPWRPGSSIHQSEVLAATIPMNERQIKVLNRLLDGFEGKLTTAKWAVLAKCSQDTALRDITELLHHGVLQRSSAGGRSTSYELPIVSQ